MVGSIKPKDTVFDVAERQRTGQIIHGLLYTSARVRPMVIRSDWRPSDAGASVHLSKVGVNVDLSKAGASVHLSKVGVNVDLSKAGASVHLSEVGVNVDLSKAGVHLSEARVIDDLPKAGVRVIPSNLRHRINRKPSVDAVREADG